jgi:hypothetical protein
MVKQNDIAEALRETLISPNVSDSNLEPANVVDVIHSVSRALRWLGNADAARPMGAIEAHGVAIKEAAEMIASAITDLAEAIREHGSGTA